MKFETKDLIYIALLVVAGYFLFQMNIELSGANSALKTVNSELEDQKEENIKSFKELQKKINSQVDLTKKLKIDITDLEASKKIINKNRDEKKTIINRTYNADSLASIISRRYR